MGRQGESWRTTKTMWTSRTFDTFDEAKGRLNKRCMSACIALDGCIGHQYKKKCNGAGSGKCCIFKKALDSDFLNVASKFYIKRDESLTTRRELEDDKDDVDEQDFR